MYTLKIVSLLERFCMGTNRILYTIRFRVWGLGFTMFLAKGLNESMEVRYPKDLGGLGARSKSKPPTKV